MRFIRHVDRKRYLRGGSVFPDAFRCRVDRDETALSLTLQSDRLASEAEIDAYQGASVLPSGDLPGLVIVTEDQLSAVGLMPRPEQDDLNPKYGDLHHVIDCPSEEQAAELAMRATENGILRDFRRH